MVKFPTIRLVVAKNVKLLMAANESLNTIDKLASKPGLSKGTISRVKDGEVGASIDTIESFARAFHIEPWQILHIDMGASLLMPDQWAELTTIFNSTDESGRSALMRLARGMAALDATTVKTGK